MKPIEYVELDVRPILRAGGEPFEKIMEAVATLAPDKGLRLLATFKPTPLFHVLGSKGYAHSEKPLADGDWEIEFYPNGAAPAAQAGAQGAGAGAGGASADAAGQAWPEPAQSMDVRELDPPEPMVNILATIEGMADGQVLAALLNREPLFLLPELAKRGHQWRGGFEADTYKLLVRVGAGREEAA
ncbi:DUF2249 domain-containing protein [Candidimonas nitroreducens]|uniref:Universal stress protein n=1 Tax=Candidimonas nitroreducens TaxID=683354 RepID=A0A225M1T3_9BURK|nr:DUF2249 domain-containing protein [Candidimonas nitroreducens]OWT55287.1 universal stress protein [Candidimonas nitroreducens]